MPSRSVQFEKERGVTDVQVTHGIGHFVVRLAPGGEGSPDEGALRLALLKALAGASVPLFMVKLHPGAISFAVREEASVTAAETTLKGAGDLTAGFTVTRDLALVSILAGAMRDLSGVMAAIYEELVGQGVTVCQTADAYNAVHLLVPGESAERGARALYRRFALEAPTTDTAETTGGDTGEGVGLKSL